MSRMYTSDGFIDPSTTTNNASTSSNPRIIELLDSTGNSINSFNRVDNNGQSQPIITTPDSGTLSFMSSPGNSHSTVMSPLSRPSLGLSNASQQEQQQQTSDAAMDLLSNLGSSSTSATSSSRASGNNRSRAAISGRSNASSVGAGATSGLPAVPSTSSSSLQSLQPLTRPSMSGPRGNVAAFLSKLYNMVGDEASNNLIRWSDDGESFLVINHVEFAKEVLPKFFKHNNFSSFVRQLNMYGFHKVPHLQQGVLMPDADSEQWEFSNPHFQRNQPDLLYLVSRKKPSSANEDKDALTMDLTHILQEVTAIKRHQVAISTDLKNIERDHQSLWQESITARERHQRQQETIDKILRFLASVFSGEKKRAIVPSKKARLTITDGDHLDHMVGSTSLEDGRRLLEEDDEDEDEYEQDQARNPTGAKRKRDVADDGSDVVDGVLNNSEPSLNISEMNPATLSMLPSAKQKPSPSLAANPSTHVNPSLPTIPTVPAATSSNANNFSFPDYLTSFPALNYANLSNANLNSGLLNSNTLPGGFKFDPSNLTIPPNLLPNALSPVHHDMLRQISMANARDTTNNTAPPLAPLPPSLTQMPTGANVAKGVDQIAQEMERLQKSIEALSQHGLNVDNFEFDDDAYLSLADSYDPNGLGSLGNSYQGAIGHSDALNTHPSSTSAVPSSLHGSSIGANPRISTVDEEEYLEDLLDLDPV